MGWNKDMFLQGPKSGADFKAPQPGNIGGVEPDPKTMADAPGPKIVEYEGAHESEVATTRTAKPGDTPGPVATDAAMGEDAIYCPGRQDNYEAEGVPELYTPGDGADNLFTPR